MIVAEALTFILLVGWAGLGVVGVGVVLYEGMHWLTGLLG